MTSSPSKNCRASVLGVRARWPARSSGVYAGLGHCCTRGRSRKKLDADIRLDPDKTPTDQGFGDPKPPCRGRNATDICNFHDGAQFLDLHPTFLTPVMLRKP
jgi:hypothetical protein